MIEKHCDVSVIDHPAAGDIIISTEDDKSIVTKVETACADRVFYTEGGGSVLTITREEFKRLFAKRTITEVTQEVGVRY